MATITKQNKNISVIKLISLIFIPTTILMIVYIVVGNINYIQQTIPSLLLLFILASFILFPIELGVVLCASKKEFGTYSLKSAFLDYEKKSSIKIILYSFLGFSFLGIGVIFIIPFEAFLSSGITKNLPTYFDLASQEFLGEYPKGILVITGIIVLIFNGFIGPIIEELFFRGYLTSKISRFNKYAPLIITVLFSLYHLWSPFNNIFRIVSFLPIAYVTWKQKNIYIAMVAHIMGNCVGSIGLLITILNL